MSTDESQQEIARFLRRLQWAALGLAVLWVIWLLAPILSPFVFAALLGWLGDPMVDRLEARGIKRNTAVIFVFGAMTLVLVVALVLLIPLLEQQILTLVESMPKYRDWFIGTALPWLERRTGLQILSWLDPDRLFALLRQHWQGAGWAMCRAPASRCWAGWRTSSCCRCSPSSSCATGICSSAASVR